MLALGSSCKYSFHQPKKCNVLESPKTISSKTPGSTHGKIVFHETGPWCQKDLGLLLHMKVVKRVNPKNSLLNLL